MVEDLSPSCRSVVSPPVARNGYILEDEIVRRHSESSKYLRTAGTGIGRMLLAFQVYGSWGVSFRSSSALTYTLPYYVPLSAEQAAFVSIRFRYLKLVSSYVCENLELYDCIVGIHAQMASEEDVVRLCGGSVMRVRFCLHHRLPCRFGHSEMSLHTAAQPGLQKI